MSNPFRLAASASYSFSSSSGVTLRDAIKRTDKRPIDRVGGIDCDRNENVMPSLLGSAGHGWPTRPGRHAFAA